MPLLKVESRETGREPTPLASTRVTLLALEIVEAAIDEVAEFFRETCGGVGDKGSFQLNLGGGRLIEDASNSKRIGTPDCWAAINFKQE